MQSFSRYLSAFLVAIAAVVIGASPALAHGSSSDSSSSIALDFAVLGGPAVTCTDSTITGNVGVDLGGAVTQTNCTISGTNHEDDAVAQQAYDDFLVAYDALEETPCTNTTLTGLGGQSLAPGVYCFAAAVTETGTALTLAGPPNGIWLFKIGTDGTGALTGTNFTVTMEGGGQACNVSWWVAEAASMTDSVFQGNILAGAAITVTRGSLTGSALAKAAVTLTDTTVTGCASIAVPGDEGHGDNGHGDKPKQHCNQGVGNGPEDCDPGKSNQGDDARSNDETGGTRGNPGRKGGNKP